MVQQPLKPLHHHFLMREGGGELLSNRGARSKCLGIQPGHNAPLEYFALRRYFQPAEKTFLILYFLTAYTENITIQSVQRQLLLFFRWGQPPSLHPTPPAQNSRALLKSRLELEGGGGGCIIGILFMFIHSFHNIS